MTHYAYLFEAKGLQAFLGDTGRLIDLIGGSNLIASIAGGEDDLLSKVLESTGLADTLEPSRRASGAICLHGTDRAALARLRAAWRLRLASDIPGLPFADVLTGGYDTPMAALDAAYASQSGLRENGVAGLLPLAMPGCELDPQTARPGVITDYEGDHVLMDRVTATLRAAGRTIAGGKTATDPVSQRFLYEGDGARFVFPRHFDLEQADGRNPAFPFLRTPHRIGVVHADISGLGQIFMRLVERSSDPATVLAVATGIEGAIEAAAREAIRMVILPEAIPRETDGSCKRTNDADLALHAKLFGGAVPDGAPRIAPFRPVLLGGDDLTAIVRADLAIPFAVSFLEALERHSRAAFGGMEGVEAELLTACAGIALVSNGHPYAMAAHLADSMCDAAKAVAKEDAAGGSVASALTFASVESAIGDDYGAFRDRELTTAGGTMLTGAPYFVGEIAATGRPRLANLSTLADRLAAVRGRGKLFEAAHEDAGDPVAAHARFWEVVHASDPEGFEDLADAMEALTAMRPRVFSKRDFLAMPEEAKAARRRELPFLIDALELIDAGSLRIGVHGMATVTAEASP